MEPLARSRDPEIVVNKLLELYRQAGNQEYHGEKVSQLEHALQTAQQAVDAPGSEEEIIAALLHDIGHIWPDDNSVTTGVGVVEHDRVGSKVLRSLGFSDAVAEIVAGHVAAKRYLVANDEDYASKLSEVSVESLRLQGGPMSAEESDLFSQAPWSGEKVRVRVWDDRAKTPGAPVALLETYRGLLLDHLRKQKGVDA
jgi:putative nucleotidyltransferase with HDIG domain